MVRVLQVIPFFIPSVGFGGSLKHVYWISKFLVKEGFDVTVYTSDMYKPNERLTDRPLKDDIDGIRVVRLPTRLRLGHYYVTPGMKSLILNSDFNIIHAHNYRNFQADSAYFAARKSETPYVLTAHGSIPPVSLANKIVKKTYDLFFRFTQIRHADGLVAVHKDEIKDYSKIGVDFDKIHLIPYGVNVDEFKNLPDPGEFRARYGIGEESPLILYVGRIHERKGLQYLLSAFKLVRKEFPRAKLAIVGSDDGYKQILLMRSRILKINEDVIFTGVLSGKRLLSAYISSDVLVLPSRQEVFGIVVLEAFLCNKPVIVTEDCGSRDLVIQEKNGYIVRYGDYNILTDSLKNVLSLSEEERKKMGERGKQIVLAHFTAKKSGEKHVKLYNELLAE